MYTVALRDEIRTWVLVQGKSQRATAQHFGISRNTVVKLLEEAPERLQRRYQRQVPRKTPVRDAVMPHLQGWVKENEWLQRWAPKQRWTAHRMWVELQHLGIGVAESTVRHLVRDLRPAGRPAYVPLDFAPGARAEFDFGEALVKFEGQLCKVPFLAGRLRFSGAMFVECFPTQRQEAFLLGQQHAFAFWGGVPRMAVYDNLKAAVTAGGSNRRPSSTSKVSIGSRPSLPVCTPGGRKAVWRTWWAMPGAPTLCQSPRRRALTSSTCSCANSARQTKHASWLAARPPLPRCSRPSVRC